MQQSFIGLLRTLVLAVWISALMAAAAQADRLIATGQLTFLRVHEVGSGFGPSDDFIDVEAVVKLSTLQGKSLGFQLRGNAEGPAHSGMLDLLRDAFASGWPVTIEYDIEPGKSNGVILRTTVWKP